MFCPKIQTPQNPTLGPTIPGNKGVTLLEILAAMALSGVILLGLGFAYVGAWHAWRSAMDRMAVHQLADISLDIVSKETRLSNKAKPLGDQGLWLDLMDSTEQFEARAGKLFLNGQPLRVFVLDSAAQCLAFSAEPHLEPSGAPSIEFHLQMAAGQETLSVASVVFSRNGSVTGGLARGLP